MKIDSLLIAAVLIGIFATGLGMVVSNMATTYNVPLSEEMTNTFGSYNTTNTLSQAAIDDLKAASTSGSGSNFDLIQTLIASLNVVKDVLVTGVPNFLIMITNIGAFIPLPDFMIRGFQSILIISVAFALVYLFLRYKNE